jgi:hypothetical protein
VDLIGAAHGGGFVGDQERSWGLGRAVLLRRHREIGDYERPWFGGLETDEHNCAWCTVDEQRWFYGELGKLELQ